MTVADYLESIKARLLADQHVLDFHIVRERQTLVDGHLRVRATLTDLSELEFSEYMQRTGKGEIEVVTYSFHWADDEQVLIRRWDNTPHFPNLSGFPHHVHDGATDTVHAGAPVSFFEIMTLIGRELDAESPCS